MAEITLEAGSPAERVALFFAANPDEHLCRLDVAAKFGLAPAAVEGAMQPAVSAGLVTIANDGDLGRVWRKGPRLAGWAATQKPAGAVKPARKPAVRGGVMPMLDLKALKVRTDSALPQTRIMSKGRTRHDHIFDSLTADGMSVEGIALAYQAALLKAGQQYLAMRPALAASCVLYVRRTDDKTCGVWRVAKAAADAQGLPRTPRKLQAAHA